MATRDCGLEYGGISEGAGRGIIPPTLGLFDSTSFGCRKVPNPRRPLQARSIEFHPRHTSWVVFPPALCRVGRTHPRRWPQAPWSPCFVWISDFFQANEHFPEP